MLCGIGLQLQGLLDAGHNEQFERIIYNASSDFHITFPDNKEYFAIFCEDGVLKYFAFNTEEEAERRINSFTNKLGDSTQYRIVPRSVAEMIGREHEFYQYQEVMADSDAEAAEYACKQQEIIDFIFSSHKATPGQIWAALMVLVLFYRQNSNCSQSPKFDILYIIIY